MGGPTDVRTESGDSTTGDGSPVSGRRVWAVLLVMLVLVGVAVAVRVGAV
jgi:hypothetical protein